MYIDTTANRMTRLDGTLVDDVNFGWGIFGKLHKGGHFEIHENNIGDGNWEVTYSNIDFTGKVLLFKRLKIKETQEMSDFRRIPENLSYSQGFELLRKESFSGVTVLRGVAGYGGSSVYHTDKLIRLSQDLPIILEVVETTERIDQILPRLDGMVEGGLITLEKVRVILYRAAKK